MSSPPLVSVCIITYNHSRYIRECLDSVLAQRTDFGFEIIVGDDCSSDGTGAILEEYAARHPGRIQLLLHVPKVGGTANLLSVHNAACGEFIAHLDGDDCMLPGKLQAQVDFLRAHPDHAFVAHDLQIIDQESKATGRRFGTGREPPSCDLNQLVAQGCFFAHSSKMHRRAAVRTRERDRETVDFYFHIEHARSGRAGYLDRVLGQYRRTGTGLSSMGSVFKEGVLQGHLDAYDYALDSGAEPSVVYPAKLNFRYVNAMACVRAGRLEMFDLLRSMGDEEARWMNLRQRLVFGLPAAWVAALSRLFDVFSRSSPGSR